MQNLFSPIDIGGLRLPNRIIMAPLTRSRAPGSVPNALMARYYAQRASAGLIVSEGIATGPRAHGFFDVPGLYRPEHVAGWQVVTDAVHEAGGRIAAQLWHVGRASHVSLQPNGDPPLAPSAIASGARACLGCVDGQAEFVEASMPRAVRADEIAGLVEEFAEAAKNAISAGFDAVEIHAANGYLIAQFLHAGSNQREDEYGGPPENRLRFLDDVLAAVCAAIGASRVGIRISPVTPTNDASDPDVQGLYEAVAACCGRHGLAYVHVVEGATGGPRDFSPGGRPFDYGALRIAYRAAGGQGAWTGNNAYTLELAQNAIASGALDAVSFGRDFIANPDLVHRLREGLPLAVPDRSTFYGGGDSGYTDYPALS